MLPFFKPWALSSEIVAFGLQPRFQAFVPSGSFSITSLAKSIISGRNHMKNIIETFEKFENIEQPSQPDHQSCRRSAVGARPLPSLAGEGAFFEFIEFFDYVSHMTRNQNHRF